MKRYLLSLLFVLLSSTAALAWTVYNGPTAVNNTLTSTSTVDALSAAQGKLLQDGKADFTDWASYTPVVTAESGGWTNYTVTGRYRIVAKMLTVSFRVKFSTDSAAASGLYISLPSGLTMNTAVMTGEAAWDADLVGFGILGDSGTISGVPAILYTRTSQNVLVKYYNAAAGSYLTSVQLSNTAPWTWTWQDTIDGQFTVPII